MIIKKALIGTKIGDVAQMVERALRMREVGGSMPPVSTTWIFLTPDPFASAIQGHIQPKDQLYGVLPVWWPGIYTGPGINL